MPRPEISCVIPSKNRAELVQLAIKSVLDQDMPGIEIIMIDDGSDDLTCETVKSVFPSVGILETDGIGPGRARNLGASAASSEILMFLDSDDIWTPDHASILFRLIEKGHEAAYGVTINHDLTAGGDFLIPDSGAGYSGDCFAKMARWCFTVPSSFAVTKKAFDRAGGFPDMESGEDWAFFIKLSSMYGFGFSDRIITSRMLHKGSLCCSPGIGRKIETMLHRIRKVLENTDRFKEITGSFFDKALEITQKEGNSWKTFQDFFIATRNLEPHF